MRRKVTPKAGRPRSHPLKPGFRPQLAHTITSELMAKIRGALAMSGRSQSAEVEHRLEQSFHSQAVLMDANALRFGEEIATMVDMTGEAAAFVRLWGNMLVNDELLETGPRPGADKLSPGLAEPRIRAAMVEAACAVAKLFEKPDRTLPTMPAAKITWDNLVECAVIAARDRALHRLENRRNAFKPLDTNFQKRGNRAK
jgi:hypothetical protein